MRRSICLIASAGLCLMIAGCGASGGVPASGPSVATESPAASRPSEAAEADYGDEYAGSHKSDTRYAEDEPSPDAARTEKSRPSRRPKPQSGQLTAGSLDDAENYDDFCRFVEQAQGNVGRSLPPIDLTRRVLLRVTDGQGRPIGGAHATVEADGQRQQTLQLTTASDGRAVFLADELGRQAQGCHVRVVAPGGAAAARVDLSLDDERHEIVLEDCEVDRPVQLDFALVIDTTGSMSDELEYLKSEIDSIVCRVRETFPNVDQRFALVVYRDQGDEYVTRTFDFTPSLEDLRRSLSKQQAGGGGDYPEAVHLALEQAAGLDWRNGNVARVLFLVGDAPPHDHEADQAFDAVARLRQQGVRVFPVASSGVQLHAECVMRSAAFLTLGQYLFLTDHSGIGNAHAKPHAPQYLVERLDRLMIRMVTSELCGRRLLPDEVLAIERGDMEIPYGPGTIPPEQQQTWHRHKAPMQASLGLQLPDGAKLWMSLGAVLLGICLFDSIRSGRA